jgi:hypothetical protein
MVSEQMDMLSRDEAEPANNHSADKKTQRKCRLIEEIAENGEAIITFKNSHTTEVHGDDTHFFPARGIFFTEDETPDGEEAETWYFAEDVLSLQRH